MLCWRQEKPPWAMMDVDGWLTFGQALSTWRFGTGKYTVCKYAFLSKICHRVGGAGVSAFRFLFIQKNAFRFGRGTSIRMSISNVPRWFWTWIDVRATHPQGSSKKISSHKKTVAAASSWSLVWRTAGDQDLDHTAFSIAELSLRLQLPRWGGKSALGLDGDGHDVEVPRGCLEGEDGGWLRLVWTFDWRVEGWNWFGGRCL